MQQLPVELILLRQVAEYLDMAMALVDADGNIVFWNEPMEALLGRPFEHGDVANGDGGPSHAVMTLEGAGGVSRTVAVTGLPLVGHEGARQGAMTIMWEVAP